MKYIDPPGGIPGQWFEQHITLPEGSVAND